MEDLKREEEAVLAQRAIRALLGDPRLTAWEQEFLRSIASMKLPLSERQTFILERIRRKCR